MNRLRLKQALVAGAGLTLLAFNAPSWLALVAGGVFATLLPEARPVHLKQLTNWTLQLGVVALGAGMNLAEVWQVGSTGGAITALSLTVTLVAGFGLARLLGVSRDAGLLISVGTVICGGSAIASVASVIKPKAEDTTVALGVVFMLNAVGLLLFPVLGHAMGLSEEVFGRWAALAIHDTSSVVGAGRAYGVTALEIATTTKLARALWVVPLTLVIAALRRNRSEGWRKVKWPWFIVGFIAVSAAFTWIPGSAIVAPIISALGGRALMLALFWVGLSLSPSTLRAVGMRPLWLALLLWTLVSVGSLPLAFWAAS